MEAQKQKYFVTVDDLGQFDLDDDRSIAPSIEYALEQAGIEAVVDQNEFRRDMVAVMTTATADEVQKALQHDEIDAEVSMMEDNEEMVHTGPGHFKQDDFTTSVKKSKKFKYVPARHGDNGLADEDTQTKESIEEQEQRYQELMKEYKEFVESEEDQKKKVNENTNPKLIRGIVKQHEKLFRAVAKEANVSPQQLLTDPMFQEAIGTLFRIGRSKNDYGQIVPISEPNRAITTIKQAIEGGLRSKASSVIRQMKGSPENSQKVVDDTVNRLEKIPTGAPFSDLEEYVKTIDDVAKLKAISEFALEILRRSASRERFSRLGRDIGGIGKAFGDLEQTVSGQ